ncbi:MAG: hypothetical protein R3325_14650 [Thermoanaerobaculia bacterium]|nr:hypothetical protein [Thermoanaerobaculia bacterium]
MTATSSTERPAADVSFTCPRCGGESPVEAGERILVCPFCDTPLYVDRSGVVGHFRVPRLLDREQAAAALRRWMAGTRTVKDLDRKSSLDGLDRVTFPVWMFRTRARGEEMVFVEPAAPTPIPQLADLDLPAGRLEPFDRAEEGAEAVPATVPLETARGWLDQRGARKVTETALVEVPLWRARYTYRGEGFQALVDASTGQVLASVFPEKSESPYVLVGLLGLVLFGGLGLLISNPLLKLLAYGVVSLPLLLIAWWVTRKV